MHDVTSAASDGRQGAKVSSLPYGTRCGDGSPYALRIRLAPVGEPVGRVMIHLQGGGLCLAEADCLTVAAGLFAATDNGMPNNGLFSTNPAVNPVFATWTHVHLPYCTQDLHIGGGAVSNFPGITVNRFGALNVRGALRYVRDVLWTELDATSPDGYRPDQLEVLFSGTSAGAFGVDYNYHYALDDLRWARTTAAPDAGLGLDNGGIGILLLGAVMLSNTPPAGWGAAPFMPPYCFGAECPVVPSLLEAHAARLLATPEQQILQISNQNDAVQVSTTLFPDLVSWINAPRTSYCALQGTPGLHWFLPAQTVSIHGTVTNATHFAGLTAAGVVLGDWLGDAVNPPRRLHRRRQRGHDGGDVRGGSVQLCGGAVRRGFRIQVSGFRSFAPRHRAWRAAPTRSESPES